MIEVKAGCRLHFGLYGFGSLEGERNFGGVGVMLETPALHVQIASTPGIVGPHAERVRDVLACWHQHAGLACRGVGVEVVAAPPHHRGLGVGTALAMSLAAGLRAFYGMPAADAETLAVSVRRGRRSAVGAHGFQLGGLIAEQGKLADEPLAPLERRLPLPSSWRFLLATPVTDPGLSGVAEVRAFRRAPAVSAETRQRLQAMSQEQLLPAAAEGRFAEFSEAVFQFGRAAGECFSTVQGGPYNGAAITQLVERIRGLGIAGVGQSSWGPTVYAACESATEAEALEQQLRRSDPSLELHVAKIRNCGASVKILG